MRKNSFANFLTCKEKQPFAFEQIVLKTNSEMYTVLFSVRKDTLQTFVSHYLNNNLLSIISSRPYFKPSW